jgi:hypothetical protein
LYTHGASRPDDDDDEDDNDDDGQSMPCIHLELFKQLLLLWLYCPCIGVWTLWSKKRRGRGREGEGVEGTEHQRIEGPDTN